MNRIRTCSPGDVKDQIAAQIRFRRGCRPEQKGLIRLQNMQRCPVRIRVNSDRCDTKFAAGALDTQSYLATIGDKNLAEGINGGLGCKKSFYRLRPSDTRKPPAYRGLS